MQSRRDVTDDMYLTLIRDRECSFLLLPRVVFEKRKTKQNCPRNSKVHPPVLENDFFPYTIETSINIVIGNCDRTKILTISSQNLRACI